MLPIEKLRAVRHIVTHANCPDGIATAMILRDVLPDAKVTWLQYETQAHILLDPEEGMLFCDFSPNLQRVKAFVEAGAIVLDHHKSQEGVVKAFRDLGVFADEKTEPGVCGATLAYREVWMPLKAILDNEGQEEMDTGPQVQQLAVLAGIRDTWQKKNPRWAEACAQAEALTFWPIDDLLDLRAYKWAEKLAIGPVLFERKLRTARKCLENGVKFSTHRKERKVVMFDNLRASSDAAEIGGSEYDFVVGFGYNSEERPTLIYSTRSHTGFNCSAFALAHGGGGHTAAAGFSKVITRSMLNPYDNLRQLLFVYEQVEDRWLKIVEARQGQPDFRPSSEYQELLRETPHEVGTYTLQLDTYQRDNLVWLLTAVGYPAGQGIDPFTEANTGDWVGQIAHLLDWSKGVGQPNMTLDELRTEVTKWP